MMDVKTASKKWHVSKNTVCLYCRDGVIPGAYKEKGKWQIPNMKKPPAGRNGIVQYLKIITAINEGTVPDFGDYDFVKEIYKYISTQGFTTPIIITDNAVESLKDVKISSLGLQLISAEECGTKRETETMVRGEIKKGPFTVDVSHSTKKY